MVSGIRAGHLAAIRPQGLACSVTTRRSALCAGALVVMLFPISAAHAQCTAVGLNPGPGFPTGAAVTAVAGVSASVCSLVSSIHSTNTTFLTQSSAFIGSPPNPQPDQPGGGVWARGIGGHLTYGTIATAGNINFGGPVPGNLICNTRTPQDFAGIQIGADVARLNVNGWNLHAGSTVGYTGLNTKDATPAGLNPPPSFRDDLQVPFAGAYVAASKGGFLVDAQVRANFFQNEVSDANHGMSGQRFDARGISLIANVAYYQTLGNNWFIEPSAGIVWSRTRVDSVSVPGTIVLGQGGIIPPWVLAVDDIESTLGRLSVRIGRSVALGNVVLWPFASASVFHEFQGGATSNLASNFPAIGIANLPPLSSTVSVASVGTYGQFALGFSAQIVNTGWLGYLRGDYRTGDNIEGWSVNGGLRYQFVPDPMGRGAVIAKAPIFKAPAQTLYNWTGFYIGAQLGTDWGFTRWNIAGAGATNPRFAGFLGGGEIGYNYQVGKWVLGVEGDLSWTNARGARPCPNGFFYNCEISVNWLSTATARIGYAYWDRLLAYVKGGAAIARDRIQIVCNTPSPPTNVVGCPAQSDSQTKAGWTVGGGSEFGLTRNVSVKAEIAYFNLDSDRANMAGILADVRRDGFISTAGLRVRLGD